MIGVIGTFRFPLENVEQARALMQDVIAATLQEEGCLAYSYAQDVGDAGLFHVTEIWSGRDVLARHFDTAHMRGWVDARNALGFHDRAIRVFPLGVGEEL